MIEVTLKTFDKEQYLLVKWWWEYNMALQEGNTQALKVLKTLREKQKAGDKTVLTRAEDNAQQNPSYFKSLAERINRGGRVLAAYHRQFATEIAALEDAA